MGDDDIAVEGLKMILDGHANLNLKNMREYLSQYIITKGVEKPSTYQLGHFEGYAEALDDICADEKILKEVRSIIEPIVISGATQQF